MNLVPTHSNCTSPMDYISHHALHSHIPVHHYTNPPQLSPFTHQLWLPHHTCTHSPHSHKSSTQTLTPVRSLVFPWLHFWAFSYSSCYLCVSPPDCLTLDLWTCACDPDFCLVLFTSLPCLWYSCFLPADLACLILPIKYAASGSTRLWPFLTEDFATSDPAASSRLTQPNYGQRRPTPTSSPGRPWLWRSRLHQFCELSLPGSIVRRVSIQGLVLFWTQ